MMVGHIVDQPGSGSRERGQKDCQHGAEVEFPAVWVDDLPYLSQTFLVYFSLAHLLVNKESGFFLLSAGKTCFGRFSEVRWFYPHLLVNQDFLFNSLKKY